MSKKIVQINIVCRGSTGKIMREIQECADENGFETYSFCGRGAPFSNLRAENFEMPLEVPVHFAITLLFTMHGHGSYLSTKSLIKKLKMINPDVIHLHNVHGFYLNLKVLFEYLKYEYKGSVIWTMHDCWAFTGYCSHFISAGCNKWKTHCENCPKIRNSYPYGLFFDTSRSEFDYKKKLFLNIPNLKIIAPSSWMESLLKQSFLKSYPILKIHNWIDFKTFVPSPDNIDFKKKYNIGMNKKIVLGVSNVWEDKKGLKIFYNIAKEISDDYQILLVGLNDLQLKKLPKKIIGIKRTTDIKELVMIYSSAYVLLNPSIEESFSLVTLEALACNTRVIVQNTSAVHEMVDRHSGIVLSDFECSSYLAAIEQVGKLDQSDNKIRQSVLKYNKEFILKQYLKLYEGDFL